MKTIEEHKEKMRYTYTRIRGRKNHHKRKLSVHDLKLVECHEEGWDTGFNMMWIGYHLSQYKKYSDQQDLLADVLNIRRQ